MRQWCNAAKRIITCIHYWIHDIRAKPYEYLTNIFIEISYDTGMLFLLIMYIILHILVCINHTGWGTIVLIMNVYHLVCRYVYSRNITMSLCQIVT